MENRGQAKPSQTNPAKPSQPKSIKAKPTPTKARPKPTKAKQMKSTNEQELDPTKYAHSAM